MFLQMIPIFSRLFSHVLVTGLCSFLALLFYYIIVYFIPLLLIPPITFLPSFETLLHIHLFVRMHSVASVENPILSMG